jgi:hypothetical protein
VEEATSRADTQTRATRKSTSGARATAASLGGSAAATVADITASARTVASDAAARLPEAMSTSMATFDRANQRIHDSSDEMLRLGTAAAFGFAAGLLIGGGNRILVGVAMVPVAMMGLTLLDRVTGGTRSGSTTPGGL